LPSYLKIQGKEQKRSKNNSFKSCKCNKSKLNVFSDESRAVSQFAWPYKLKTGIGGADANP